MRLDAGKLLIVGIFVFALFAAGFAVWFRSQQGKQALGLWGVDTAARIRNAQDVQLRFYSPPLEDIAKATDSKPTAKTEVSQVADLIHIRRVFLDDVHILWDAPQVEACAPSWEYALLFRDAQGTTTVWVDSNCYNVRIEESGAQTQFNPPVLRSVIKFFDRRLGRESRPGSAPAVN